MAIDYKEFIKDLKMTEPDITSVAIIGKEDNLVYSTEDWDISTEVNNLVSLWKQMENHFPFSRRPRQFIFFLKNKYSILQCTPERLVATRRNHKDYLIGAKDDERIIISHVKENSWFMTVYSETVRILRQMSNKEPYMSVDSILGKYKKPDESDLIRRQEDRKKRINELENLKQVQSKELYKAPDAKMTQQFSKWEVTSLKREVIMSVIDFFKKGSKLEKPDGQDLQRRKAEKKLRIDELEKVLRSLEISKEVSHVKMIIKAKFNTDYIYDDFHLLKIKQKIIDLLKQEFQTDYLDLKITKKL